MTWTPNTLFMLSILTINLIVWILLALPNNRQKLPKIYLIVRSWLWMLFALFLCFYLSGITDTDGSHRPYWWAIDLLLAIIGVRGLFEISRLWRSKSKVAFVEKLESLNVQPAPAQSSSRIHSNNSIHSSSTAQKLNRSKRLANWWQRVTWVDTGLCVAFIYLIISLMALAHLTLVRQQAGMFLFVIFASQFNDIAQYLCGRWLGGRFFKRKLAPTLSPNKTIEGALFGSLLSASLATLLGLWLTPFSVIQCFMMAYFLAISGIIGDLFESSFKRRHGIKDTGTMLAGHGGILDRVDSLLIGVPVMTFIYWQFL
ncbi:phosphatidate cytidylyltransferase [Psychrobacter sp. FDAARGOS_221]|uniref:phosphatidate cytidylyltransferase n=1 Tax=Psychrobacter sp. FDAARGOS_221 TaxID=1975705 RepID=UPI000BB55FEE|nr:phosphatidate cytidylyltransferase [Psychrobacter sp. FDAARGOS_221]PNK61060.1 hypothetical protein A6J60_009350 [Psychrobacter sp. FDAARGOS_221]